MSDQRQPGWYWVQEWMMEDWQPRYWSDGGFDGGLSDEVFAVIGPRIPTPDEPWQTVPTEVTPDMLDVQTLGNLVTASRRWRDTLAVAPDP